MGREPHPSEGPFQAGLRILAGRDHATGELREKLQRRGFDPEETEAALEALSAKGFLDDQRFSEAFARYRLQSGHGFIDIRNRLRRMGITAEESLVDPDEELISLQELLKRRRIDVEAFGSGKDRARALRFLVGRGFRNSVLKRALGTLIMMDSSEDEPHDGQ